jgi:pilus assembly protein Flp/PilA
VQNAAIVRGLFPKSIARVAGFAADRLFAIGQRFSAKATYACLASWPERWLSFDQSGVSGHRPCNVQQGHKSPQSERTIMKNVATIVKQFLKSEDGPTAVEYAVMLALIIVVCLTAIQAVGTNANNKFNAVQNALT